MRYAEVIGDPIAQSKSPIIHKFWLDSLGLSGAYRKTQVSREGLAAFFDGRRTDPDWLGCNVTIPHKERAAAIVDQTDMAARAIGAVNCVVPSDGKLVGYNTDVDGIAAALKSAEIRGRKAVVIGAGGAARAVVSYLAGQGLDHQVVLARNPERGNALQALIPTGKRLEVLPFDQVAAAFDGAMVIVNASPLGMAGAKVMPRPLLDALANHAAGATIFDMVTTPARTAFLDAGAVGGGHLVDGVTMLVGQAARAFALFYGAEPPPADRKLRDLLTTDSQNSG